MAVPFVKLNEDRCPVKEKLFDQLRRASPPDAAEVALTLPEQQRAELAAFCYSKSHLHALGLMIAASCSRDALARTGSPASSTIYHQSRDPEKTLSAELNLPGSRPAKPVSLAGPKWLLTGEKPEE